MHISNPSPLTTYRSTSSQSRTLWCSPSHRTGSHGTLKTCTIHPLGSWRLESQQPLRQHPTGEDRTESQASHMPTISTPPKASTAHQTQVQPSRDGSSRLDLDPPTLPPATIPDRYRRNHRRAETSGAVTSTTANVGSALPSGSGMAAVGQLYTHPNQTSSTLALTSYPSYRGTQPSPPNVNDYNSSVQPWLSKDYTNVPAAKPLPLVQQPVRRKAGATQEGKEVRTNPSSGASTMQPRSKTILAKRFEFSSFKAHGTTPDQKNEAKVSGYSAGVPDSPAAQHIAALKRKKSGKARLRRVLSFGSAAKKLWESDEHKAQIHIHSGQGHFFTGSTDNLSISSTASSASVMIREMGSRSLVGLFRPKSVIGVPATDSTVLEPSVAPKSGGEEERAETLAAVKKGILKRTDSGPVTRPLDAKAPEIPPPHCSSSSSTPADEHGPRVGDYLLSTLNSASGESKSMPGIPRDETGPHGITFAPQVEYHSTWPPAEYDRRGEIATCHRLTPILARQIRQELNTFKKEMEVHHQSKIYTQFF